ncbi:hypothetical protein P5673_003787 [Acropora cervicornis]|uniref:Uncharacterized protein n=1 Tax=Acropora cervicornis TaxID=6130 RepID=A0AAD9R1W8_ACRCE|nr:hypothetical protein P5673_003787 [Acropora cervicornis]
MAALQDDAVRHFDNQNNVRIQFVDEDDFPLASITEHQASDEEFYSGASESHSEDLSEESEEEDSEVESDEENWSRETLGKASSPVKLLSNFKTQDDGSLKTILMDNRLQIADTKVSFPPKPKPQTNNIASLSGVHLQRLILQIGATNMVTTSNSVKRKAECYLTDPSGTITLKLWEDFINDV